MYRIDWNKKTAFSSFGYNSTIVYLFYSLFVQIPLSGTNIQVAYAKWYLLIEPGLTTISVLHEWPAALYPKSTTFLQLRMGGLDICFLT